MLVYYGRRIPPGGQHVEDWPYSIEELVRAAVTSPRDYDYVMHNWTYAKTVFYYLMSRPDS